MKRPVLLILVGWLLLQVQAAHTEEIVMARSTLAFPEAMLVLQDSIREHGYVISHVQRVDIGLTGMGYATDKYRIVFAGKAEEIRKLTEAAPQLIPFMPPKISIFAEGEQTLLVTAHPKLYAEIAGDAVDPVIFERWTSDLVSIFNDVRTAK